MIIEDIPGFLRDEKPHDVYRRIAQEMEDRRANQDWKRQLEAQRKRDEAVALHIGSLENAGLEDIDTLIDNLGKLLKRQAW